MGEGVAQVIVGVIRVLDVPEFDPPPHPATPSTVNARNQAA
jgi:hypothetical protein